MITYESTKAGAVLTTRVMLEGRWIGIIKEVPGGWQYFPKRGEGGTIHPTLQAVKRDLESE